MQRSSLTHTNKGHFSFLLFLIIVASLWYVASIHVNSFLLPKPIAVIHATAELLWDGSLGIHLYATVFRVVSGFLVASFLAITLTICAYTWTSIHSFVHYLNALLSSVSVIIWITLAIFWFGIRDATPIFVTSAVALPLLLSNLLGSINSIDIKLLEMAAVYKINSFDELRDIVLPHLLSNLTGAIRASFGLCLKMSVVSEMFGVTRGVGYMLNYSRETLDVERVFAWALVLVMTMLIFDICILKPLIRQLPYESS